MSGLVDRIGDVLRCPGCGNRLIAISQRLVCAGCKREFSYTTATIHFIDDENDRPSVSKRLSTLMYSDDKYTVGRGRRYALERYDQERSVRDYVEYAQIDCGLIVDLASGPSGGYIHNILEKISPNTVLVASDACPWVIDKYSEYYGRRHPGQFGCIDMDLDKRLPFADGSIDVFTGVLLDNVGNYRGLLQEVSRCLKKNGRAVFHEMFFSRQSETFKVLSSENAVYASDEVFCNFCSSVGMDTIEVEACWKGTGKLDPRDGIPVNDQDEWYRKDVYMVRR